MRILSTRDRLLSSTFIAGALLFSTAASAQTTAAAADADEAAIIVTGSRIASSTLDSASPLQIVDSTAIESTGAANLQDVLLQSPIFGTPAVSRTNSNFSTSGAGLATVDLRNLGTARTLVLVNGRRFVSGSPNDQAVDLNTIPTAFIQRTDILTGGASSIYGSDAVAGVVNIIYKTDFEGAEFNAQTGISELGDDVRYQFNGTIGVNSKDGRGNVMAYVGYSKDGSVFSRDRRFADVDQASVGAFVTGSINDLFAVTRPFNSSFAPQGRFFGGASGGSIGTFDANGNFINGFSSNGSATRAADGFNRSAFRTIALPVERFLIATRANYEITPSINVFMEGTFAKSHVETELEPFPASTSGANGIFQASGGFFPVQQRLADGTIFNNPFVPAALFSQLTDRDGDGLRDVSFTRRLSDLDNRGNIADRTTYRIVVGANGEIFNGWNWDVSYNYGRTDDNQTSSGQFSIPNFRSALVVTQVNGVLVCADAQARAQGCVPANVFGRNTLSPAAAAYVRADGNRTAFADQNVVTANLAGNLLENPLGAGPLALALGGEYRKERSAAAFDALQQRGLNGGNAIPNTSGAFDVKEGYVELRLPVLADRPFFRELTLSGAFRVSDYSTIGTVYSWNYGGVYSPVEGLRFRVVSARATRAPNVSELFQGLSQTFPTGLNDPCTGITATTAGVLGTTCRSFPGVNDNIASNAGVFTRTQADQQGISGFDGGNPLLQEERADTLTIGAVLSPKQLRGFSLSVDYSKTRIRGAIVSTPRQFILNQCFEQGRQDFCQFVTRRAALEGANSPGSLQFINSGSTNSGGVFNSNIDVTANYVRDLTADLRMNVGVTYTHVLNGYLIPTPGGDIDYFAGEVGAAKDRFLLTVGARYKSVTFQYRGTYTGKSYLDDQFVAGFTEDDGTTAISRRDPRVAVSARYYSDLQAQFEVGQNYQFYVGVNNLTNTSAPVLPSGLPGNVTGAETDSGTYDAIGRRYYAGIRLKF